MKPGARLLVIVLGVYGFGVLCGMQSVPFYIGWIAAPFLGWFASDIARWVQS
jgi:hypothetical protein